MEMKILKLFGHIHKMEQRLYDNDQSEKLLKEKREDQVNNGDNC